MAILGQCGMCGTPWLVEADPEGVEEWLGGQLVQVAFPSMSLEARELLISSTCPPCFADPDPAQVRKLLAAKLGWPS